VADEVENLQNLKVGNGSAMITDAKTGQILAMVGSKNYYDNNGGNFNVAIAPRQPGSSIKPITYATAFKQGFSPGNIILDTPVVFRNDWEVYAPGNYDGRFHGAVTLRTALGSSYNIPAVKLLATVGIPEMIRTAKSLGITTFNDPQRYGLSLTLGGGEVKLIDMMSVYGTFSQMGEKYEIQPVLTITDSKGHLLEDNTNPSGKEVLDPAVAYLITDILQDNNARTPAFGPSSLLKIAGHHVAVKTGTTDSKRDNWTFGFTPDYVVGVWVGNNNNSPMDPQLTSGITGAAPIWNKLVTMVLEGKKDQAFKKPTGVVESLVDGRKDLVISGMGQKSLVGVAQRPSPAAEGGENKSITFTDPFSTYVEPPKNP
jgi:membrane peptidoglycan carboxypeptidase